MRLAVFCGSSIGEQPGFGEAADAFGRMLAEQRIGVVYGGGHVGLMGKVADAALSAGGEVIGVIPEALERREVAHRGLTELHVVPDMHARKAMMASLSDGFVALPGGIGTLEELFEVWTWRILGYHHKPCGLLNVAGFFDELIAFLDKTVQEGFLRGNFREKLQIASDPQVLLEQLWPPV